jgi:hypothetical protein
MVSYMSFKEKGRPRIFVTQAEKQKAYRERKKQELALRNSSGNILCDPDPIPVELSNIEALVMNTSRLHRETRYRFMEMEYKDWSNKMHELQELWWKQHQEWYQSWIASGAPDTEYHKNNLWFR